MARGYGAAGSGNGFAVAAVPLTAAPLTMASWFYSTDNASIQYLITLDDGTRFYGLVLRGDIAGDPIYAYMGTTASGQAGVTTTGYSTSTWHHAAATFGNNAPEVRNAYIDGGSKGSDTALATDPGALTRTSVGYKALGIAYNLVGKQAEAAIWNVILTDAEIALLAKPVCPLVIRPENLVAYWPLIGNCSPEIDVVGGVNVTAVGTPTKQDHPKIFYYRSLRR